MGLADAAIGGIIDSVAFRSSAAPYLVLDTDLRIRAANEAYERVTLRDSQAMLGELMFDVFPDNPATPDARGVERLGISLERALSTGEPDRMALQRYDVRHPQTGVFVERTWLPTNSPIRDADRRTVAVLHHVEDVTRLLVSTALERHLVAPAEVLGGGATGTDGLVEALRRDSVARQARARMLVDHSRAAVERVARRVEG